MCVFLSAGEHTSMQDRLSAGEKKKPKTGRVRGENRVEDGSRENSALCCFRDPCGSCGVDQRSVHTSSQ